MSAVISTIINYNGGELLRSCVDSLLNCPLEIEIIVVDNASADGSLGALLALLCAQIIKSPATVGSSVVSNSGASVVSAQLLLFFNPHCLFKEGTMVRLLDAMRVDE